MIGISPLAGQQAIHLLHALCALLCFGTKLTLANMNMAATIAIRAAAVFIIPDGCSISFLHHVHNQTQLQQVAASVACR